MEWYLWLLSGYFWPSNPRNRSWLGFHVLDLGFSWAGNEHKTGFWIFIIKSLLPLMIFSRSLTRRIDYWGAKIEGLQFSKWEKILGKSPISKCEKRRCVFFGMNPLCYPERRPRYLSLAGKEHINYIPLPFNPIANRSEIRRNNFQMRQRGHHRSSRSKVKSQHDHFYRVESRQTLVILAPNPGSIFVLSENLFSYATTFSDFLRVILSRFSLLAFSGGKSSLKSIRLGPFNVDSQNEASARSVRIFCLARLSNLVLLLFYGFHSQFAKCEKWKSAKSRFKACLLCSLKTQMGCSEVYLQK